MNNELLLIILSIFSMKFLGLAKTSHVRINTKNIEQVNKKLVFLENRLKSIQSNIDFCNTLEESAEQNIYCEIFNLQTDNSAPTLKVPQFIDIIEDYANYEIVDEPNEIIQWDEDDGSRYEYVP